MELECRSLVFATITQRIFLFCSPHLPCIFMPTICTVCIVVIVSFCSSRFINARRRIVQPMIDQSNRAGRAPAVSVFKNRRRNRSDQSPGPSPGNFSNDFLSQLKHWSLVVLWVSPYVEAEKNAQLLSFARYLTRNWHSLPALTSIMLWCPLVWSCRQPIFVE